VPERKLASYVISSAARNLVIVEIIAITDFSLRSKWQK